MKKYKTSIACNVISIVLFLFFIIKTIIDYTKFSQFNSAPFSLWIYTNIILFICPAIIIFFGIIIKNKKERK